MNVYSSFVFFVKGILMGLADLVPGISGGTIAFITGIYEQLMTSVRAVSPRLLYTRDAWKQLHLPFLIPLVLGIGTSILIGAHGIRFLLDVYPAFTFSFFTGLIIGSCLIIFSHIHDHRFESVIWGIVGGIIGASLFFVTPGVVSDPSAGYIFLGGLLAVSALFLPGISGSFILLLLGLYSFVLDMVRDISAHIFPLIMFSVGALCGMVIISRLIAFLFSWNRHKTLYLLLGLVIGSLLIPISTIARTSVTVSDWMGGVLLLLVGFFLSYYIARFGR